MIGPGKAAWQRGRAKLTAYAADAARWSATTARTRLAAALSVSAALPRAAADLVFPGTCVSCQAELDSTETVGIDLLFCRACWEQLDLLTGPVCRNCGGPLPGLPRPPADDKHGTPADCFRCRGRKLWFDATIAAGLYSGLLRELLLRMKRWEGDALSLAVGQLIWKRCGEGLTALGADVVVPIPLHWRRRLAHRTNSAAILAEVVARRLGVPLADGLLRRRRHTVPQSDLSPPQRWRNVRQAFSVAAGYHLRKAHVLVVDDILTTGATCSEAARTLRRAGAERVSVVVAARALG